MGIGDWGYLNTSKNEASIVDEKDNKYFKFYDLIEANNTYPPRTEKNISITDYYTSINQKYNKLFLL